MTTKKLIIAGGGTGGHIFPGLAIAEAWRKQGGEVLWAGSNQGREKTLVPENGVAFALIPTPPVKGKGLGQKLKSAFQIPAAICKSYRLLKKEKPDAVIGVGGYVSFPVVLAAALRRLPCAIAEQNARAGLANRILGRFVKKIFLTFEDDAGQFPQVKTEVVGNPIRSVIHKEPFSASGRPFRLFLTGGSLGARILNSTFCQALDVLKPVWKDLEVIHQTGNVEFEQFQKFYQDRPQLSARCDVFIKDMATCYKTAHLIICRAGASTATEIALIGRPAIFVPYPFATDDHQTKNAEYFVSRGAAWLIPQSALSAEKLAGMISDLMANPDTLAKAARHMAESAKPNAADKIAQAMLKMIAAH